MFSTNPLDTISKGIILRGRESEVILKASFPCGGPALAWTLTGTPISGQPHDTQVLLAVLDVGAGHSQRAPPGPAARTPLCGLPTPLLPPPLRPRPSGHLRDSGFDPSIHLERVAKPRQT